MAFLRRVPLPIAALALGLAALGNLLLPYSPSVRVACGAASALVTLLLLARIALDFHGVRAELANPAALSVFPALFMALMLLATYLKPLTPPAAFALWAAALACQLALAVFFVARHVVPFELGKVVPGWFLVFVGFVVASATSPVFGMVPLGRVLLYAGMAGYAVALPVVAYRTAKGGALPAPAVPTLAIFAAPPSLCLVGYLAVIEAKQVTVVCALLAVAAASVLFVLAQLPGILKRGFLPSFAALTFPLVISAIALKQSAAFLAVAPGALAVPRAAVIAMDAVATAMVLYVAARYAIHLSAPAPAD